MSKNTNINKDALGGEKTDHVDQYDQNLLELREIINSFQKGNMPLHHAVDKYKRSEYLITECKKALADFEQVNQAVVEKEITQDECNMQKTKEENRSFEDKLKRLEQITQTIDANPGMQLKETVALVKESKILMKDCQSELCQFQHIIEYKNTNNVKS